MSAVNLRILQDQEIENFGSNKGINDLLEEVRNLVEHFIVNTTNTTSNNNNSNTTIKSNSDNNNNINGSSKFQFQNNNTILRASDRLIQNNNNSSNGLIPSPKLLNTNTNTNTSRKPIESSFIDVKKVSLKEISILLNRRRDMHIQLIKQIQFLYEASSKSESLKIQFLESICTHTTTLKSLLSFLSLYQPQIDSLDFNSQIESIKLISILTQNDIIKTFIKQAGDISAIVSLLQWSHKIPSYNTLTYHLISLVSNLSTQESCAMSLRKKGAIPPLFTVCQNETLHNDIRIIALNTLIIFSSYSNPKVSEAIIDSKSSLKLIIDQIVKHSSNIDRNSLKDSISIKFLDLLYQVSDCPKTRAFAWECGIDNLVSLIKITDIYPIELNRGTYYKISNTQPEDPSLLVKVTLQCKILQCLEKLCQHDHNVSKIGMVSTYTILNYIKPMFSIPFDLFRWNNRILEKILKFAIQILQDDNFKQVFIEKDACQIMVTMVLSDYFSPEVLLSCAQVLGQIVKPKKTSSSSRLFISVVDKIIGSDVIPSLMRLYKSFPNEKSLQILMCQVFKHLGSRDENKQIIFSEGGFQLLHSLIISLDNEVVLNSLDTLSVLSLNKFMRKVIRLVGSIPFIIGKISTNNQLVQKYSIQNIFNISLDPEGLEILLNPMNGIDPSDLITLLYINDSDIQLATLKTLNNLINNENYFELFIQKGAILSLLNSLYSNDENVQYQVLLILNKIIQKQSVQESIISNGIIDKLKKLSTHENLTKSNSILVQPFKTLLLSVKSIPQHIIENHMKKQQAINSPPVSIKNSSPNPSSNQIQNQQQSPNTTTNINKRFSPPPNTLPSQQASNYNINKVVQNQQPIQNGKSTSQSQPPDFKKIENVLLKLNENQLRELVVDIIKQNNSVSDLLSSTIRGILTGNKQLIQSQTVTQPVNNISPPLPPPTNNISPPPPPINNNNLSKQSQTPSLGQLQQQIKSLGATQLKPVVKNNIPPPKKPIDNTTKFASLMDEIRSKVGSGNLNLKHIDTQKEIESRRKDQLIQKNNTILKDIVSNAQKINENNQKSNKKTLVDSSVQQGMRIWKKDFDHWKQEVLILFKRNNILTVLIFKILESIQDFPFKEAQEITGFQSGEKLAQILQRIGFNIKSSTYVQNSNQLIEYNAIIKPAGIPVKLLLSLIVDHMYYNGNTNNK